jgi:hypothetical protein
MRIPPFRFAAPLSRVGRSPSTNYASFIAIFLGTMIFSGEVARPVFSQQLATSTTPSWLPADPPTTSLQTLIQEGDRISLNGRNLVGRWSQRQQQLGVSDAVFSQLLGGTLLDTSNVAVQPVQWYTDPTTQPLALSPWLTPTQRYLDITDLVTTLGWQVSINGSTLSITTPASQVSAVRHGRQPWGDRVVLDLEQAAPWQLQTGTNEVTLTLDAATAAATVQALTTQLRTNTNTPLLGITSQGNQTVLRLRLSSGQTPDVWTLPNPARLVVDLRTTPRPARRIAWAPGIDWQEETVQLGNTQFPVVSLVVDPRQSNISLNPVWGNPAQMIGITPLATATQQWGAVAAINAGFFNRNNFSPLGALRQDGRWLSGPILNRGAIAWDGLGNVAMGRLALTQVATLSSGDRIAVLHLNSGYVQAGTSRYTPDWGPSYTPLIDNEVVVTIRGNQVVQQQPGGTAGNGAIPIPSDGYLLVVRSDSRTAASLSPGTTVQIDTASNPSVFDAYPHIVGAGPLLLQNRQIVLNAQGEGFSDAFIQQRAVRSAIGLRSDGKLLLTTMQNRVGGSGPSLTETAQIMQALGAIDALNLDGGSSTTLLLGNQVLNRPPSSVARVHNGIGVFLTPGN